VQFNLNAPVTETYSEDMHSLIRREFDPEYDIRKNLPKEKGFEAFVIIYKWSRDNLLRLRSVYIENVERALTNKKIDLQDNNTAEAQNKKDTITKQIKEIDDFKAKIDELLEEGYDPKLDDGVGKNIAPLQKKKMISYDVLNAGQLKKYLNADW
jgi:hypothetical protein